MDATDDTYAILRIKQVAKLTGLSRAGIYERMANGGFPGSVSLGGRAVGWLKSEVVSWIAERISERNVERNKVNV